MDIMDKEVMTIEFDMNDRATLVEIFKKFKVNFQSKKDSIDTTNVLNKYQIDDNSMALLEEPLPKFGFMKGQFLMSDDFDEPLGDFENYM